MKVLVTGAMGQLGKDVLFRLHRMQIPCRGTGRADLDITDREAVLAAVKAYNPDAVIHCAAFTDVDRAEEEREPCRTVNVDGTRNLALACRASGAKLLYVSTDFVFGGEGNAPYETDSPRSPLNYYGLTKAMGEDEVRSITDRHFIVRTSWVFGRGGNNFVETMLRLGGQNVEVSVVSDQTGSPTYATDLAKLLCAMVLTERYGTYHAAGEGFCSRSRFAQEIFRQAGLPVSVRPVLSKEYPSRAARPSDSRLSTVSLAAGGFSRLPCWQDALKRYLIDPER
jgi:dTDP-4-dehydrorhamnose reductase